MVDKTLEPCYFEHICGKNRAECLECRLTGNHYIARGLFIKNSNIPLSYLPSKADPGPIIRNQDRDFIIYCKTIVDKTKEGQGVYMWSKTTGNGKTTVGCNLLLKYIIKTSVESINNEIDCPVLYLNVVELLDGLRGQMNEPDVDFQFMWKNLFSDKAPKLLLLDDIGAERPSDWVRERLYSLINFRSANKLSTIYTSNCSPEDLELSLGARCSSRILGDSLIVNFKGIDRRRN